MYLKVLVLTFLCTQCTTHAFHTVFPEGKELVYDYLGTISTSSRMPRLYVSSFTIVGNLHIQTDNHTVYAKLTNVRHEIYNGLESDYDSKELPLPEEMADLTKTFRIDYLPTGNVMGIATGMDEKPYVVNLKKAISSMLQLDMEMMKKHESQKAYAFHTDENTLYGKGKVYYNVKSLKDHEHIDVMQEPRGTEHMYTHLLTNVDIQEHTLEDYDEPLSRDSQRSCVLNKVGDERILDIIKHNGGIYYTPFNGHGEGHTLNINQSLVLTTTKPISSKMEVEGELYHHDLTYHMVDLKHVDSVYPDFTNGRRMWPVEGMAEKAIALVKEIVDFMAEYQIEDKMMDLKKTQLLGRLTHMMLFMDEKILSEIHEKLSNEVHDPKRQYVMFYLQMLPETGTHAAYHLMMKLIKDKKITDQNLLRHMFDNAKFPNKKMVEDMAEILKWDSKDYAPGIYKTAMLSFGSLLHKAMDRNRLYTRDPKTARQYGYHPHNHLEEEFPDVKYYEKYILELVGRLKATKDQDMRILLLETLHNTEMESIVQHLLPAVRGDWWEDDHLRMLAMLAISPSLVKSEELTLEILWPLMTNSDLPTTLRIMSYYVIMESQPSLPRLLNMYWTMNAMKHHDLYMFHYKYITALSESETPHNRKFIVHLKQILKYTEKPVFRGITGYHHLDYYNDKYALGEALDLMIIHSKQENDIVIAGGYEYTVNGLSATPYWIYLRISGFHPSFLKELKLDTTSKKMLFTWGNLLKLAKNLGKNDDATLTLVLATNGHIVATHYFDKTNIMDIMAVAQKIRSDLMGTEQSIDVSYELSRTLIMPSDMGFPAILFNYVPDIDYSDIVISTKEKDDEMKLSLDIKFKSLRNARRGLAFYNPVLDVFQGVDKLHTMDYSVNFKVDASIDTALHMLKISWKKIKDAPNDATFAERNYVATMVYVLDDFKTGALQKSSAKSENIVHVDLGEEYKMNQTLADLEILTIGNDFIERIFEQEMQLPKELTTDLDLDIDYTEDMQTALRSLMYHLRFEELQPDDVNYGMTKTLKLNKDPVIDIVEIALKLDTEYKKGNNYLYPAVTHKMKLHYNSGVEGKTVSSWMLEGMLNMDDGHLNNAYKLHLAQTMAKEEVKICLEGESIWSNNGLKSSFHLSSNLLEDRTCSEKDALLTFQMVGEKSEAQLKNMYSYHTCFANVFGPIDYQRSLECLLEHDSLRKYTINLRHGFGDHKRSKPMQKLADSAVAKIFTDRDSIKPIEGLEENEMRIIFDDPMRPAAPLSVQVHFKDIASVYVVSESLESGGLNTVFGGVFESMHTLGLTELCVVNNHKMKHSNRVEGEVEYAVPKDWAMFLGTSAEPKFEVMMKSTEGNNMMIKIVFKTHTLLVEPKDHKYMITIDGTVMESEKASLTNDWMHYAMVKDTPLVSIYIKNIGVHMIYNGYQASIEYPQIEGVEMHGHCLDEHK